MTSDLETILSNRGFDSDPFSSVNTNLETPERLRERRISHVARGLWVDVLLATRDTSGQSREELLESIIEKPTPERFIPLAILHVDFGEEMSAHIAQGAEM